MRTLKLKNAKTQKQVKNIPYCEMNKRMFVSISFQTSTKNS